MAVIEFIMNSILKTGGTGALSDGSNSISPDVIIRSAAPRIMFRSQIAAIQTVTSKNFLLFLLGNLAIKRGKVSIGCHLKSFFFLELTMLERSSIMTPMNKLSTEKRSAVVSCLVEGNSIRATVRMTGVAKNTVVKLLCDLGRACSEYQDKTFRNLKCRRVQCDEIWSFVYAKEKNCTEKQK